MITPDSHPHMTLHEAIDALEADIARTTTTAALVDGVDVDALDALLVRQHEWFVRFRARAAADFACLAGPRGR